MGVSHIIQYFLCNPKHRRFVPAGNFPCHKDIPFGGKHLAGNSGFRVFLQTCIQNAVCDQVTQFIWVPFCYCFCCIISFRVTSLLSAKKNSRMYSFYGIHPALLFSLSFLVFKIRNLLNPLSFFQSAL